MQYTNFTLHSVFFICTRFILLNMSTIKTARPPPPPNKMTTKLKITSQIRPAHINMSSGQNVKGWVKPGISSHNVTAVLQAAMMGLHTITILCLRSNYRDTAMQTLAWRSRGPSSANVLSSWSPPTLGHTTHSLEYFSNLLHGVSMTLSTVTTRIGQKIRLQCIHSRTRL
jgi:hypothetical protein